MAWLLYDPVGRSHAYTAPWSLKVGGRCQLSTLPVPLITHVVYQTKDTRTPDKGGQRHAAMTIPLLISIF